MGLGIVTAVTIDLMPVPRLYAGGLYFAASDLPRVLHVWLDWGRVIPETVSTSVSILRLPPLPELPEPPSPDPASPEPAPASPQTGALADPVDSCEASVGAQLNASSSLTVWPSAETICQSSV